MKLMPLVSIDGGICLPKEAVQLGGTFVLY